MEWEGRSGQNDEVYAFVLHAYADIVQAGQTLPGPQSPDSQVIVARYLTGSTPFKRVVGVIEFTEDDNGGFWIDTSSVHADFRRKGIWEQMWNALVLHARAEGAPTIRSMMHITNTARHKSAEKTGSKQEFVTYKFDVPGLRKGENGEA